MSSHTVPDLKLIPLQQRSPKRREACAVGQLNNTIVAQYHYLLQISLASRMLG
jgi:hypothetical protein